ncbi:DNA polymerase IV [Marinicrinis sediminis]|uniref:DNA polymerase IV n=1 Tax=Marinicrinis sediminis TaxID=1652465 RepID=A0ABW5RCQ0_9BACL
MMNTDTFYPKKGRVILHIDMNAFYCSVHEAEEPEQYRGKPCAVSGSIEQRKGIIVTSSYAARKQGVRTGMRVRDALKRCPDLLLIRPDFHLYRAYSKRFMKMVYAYTPLVEPISIDECFADITGSRQFGSPLEIARALQQRIRTELGLPCSIGIAPNKLLAKMGSDMKKPMGLTILRKRDVPRLLWQEPCASLYGIGAKTAAKLDKLNIRTLGELAKTDPQWLHKQMGVLGPALIQAANGVDDAPVRSEREAAKSIGHTTTLPADISAMSDVRRVFLNLADQVSRRLRRQKMMAHTIQITIREPDMKTYTRSMTLPIPTEDEQHIYQEAVALYSRHWAELKPVRLLGITLQQLIPKEEAAVQLDLFEYEQFPRKEALHETLDQLRDKFGESSILTAGMLSDDPSALIRNHKVRGTSLQKDFFKQMSWEDEEDDPSH